MTRRIYATIEEAAAKTKISVRTIYRRVEDGTLRKYERPGNRRRIHVCMNEIERWQQPHRVRR